MKGAALLAAAVLLRACHALITSSQARRAMSEGSHIIDRDDPSAPAPLIAAAKALRRLAPSYNKFYIVGVEDARALTEAGALASQRSRFDSAFYALCGVCHTLFALTRVHDADCLDPLSDGYAGGLGCNAGGQGQSCRFCGFGAYSEFACPSYSAGVAETHYEVNAALHATTDAGAAAGESGECVCSSALRTARASWASRTKAVLRDEHTAVTIAPRCTAHCTATWPTPPEAPMMSTRWSRPTLCSANACIAVVPTSGSAAASA